MAVDARRPGRVYGGVPRAAADAARVGAYLALAGFALVIVVRHRPRRGRTSHEALARRHLAPRRARSSCASAWRCRPSAAAALGARARRRRLPLDLQPHRALPRRASDDERAVAALERARGRAARAGRLPAARRGGGGAPLPRRRRARLARPGRGRDPRPGPRRVRGGRAGRRCSTGVFRQALQVGKRVRTETAIGESPASVSSAAAALAQQVFGDLDGPARAARRRRAGSASSRPRTSPRAAPRSRTSRTGRVEAALELAERFGARAVALDDVPARLGEVDVVLASTSAPDFVVRAADVPARRRQPALLHRHRRSARRRSRGARARRLLPLRHRRPRGGRRRDARRAARRGRARRAARRRGGRAVPRLAGVARGRPGDRVAASARRGDPRRRAREARPACRSTSAARSSP